MPTDLHLARALESVAPQGITLDAHRAIALSGVLIAAEQALRALAGSERTKISPAAGLALDSLARALSDVGAFELRTQTEEDVTHQLATVVRKGWMVRGKRLRRLLA
jgi:hypothetical protein